MSEETQIIEQPEGPNSNVLAVIATAAQNPDVQVDKMKELLDMQERVMDRANRQEANQALYAFQSEVPQLQKTKTVKVEHRGGGSHGFKFCPYETMMAEVRPYMKAHGFSERFDTKVDDMGNICAVTCTIIHRGGHSWESTFPVRNDKSGSKNEIQAVGSALSYGKRYSFAAAMGIVFKDEDNDGGGPPPAAKETLEELMPTWQVKEKIDTWLTSKGYSINQFNGAIYALTKGKFKSWDKLPLDRQNNIVSSESLEAISEMITSEERSA